MHQGNVFSSNTASNYNCKQELYVWFDFVNENYPYLEFGHEPSKISTTVLHDVQIQL